MRRLLACLIVFAAPAADAGACSCALSDPTTRLEQATAAFTGTVTEARTRPGQPGPTEYTFRVERVLKGDLGATVDVHSGLSSCQVSFGVGERAHLLLHGREPWEVFSCSVLTDADVRRIDEPAPQPSGNGRVAVLVSGGYDRPAVRALDRTGKLLAERSGAPTGPLSVCPGSRHVLQAGSFLGTRRIGDLRVVRRRRLTVSALRCLSGDGLRAVVSRRPGLQLLEGDRLRTLVGGPQHKAVLGRRRALVFTATGPALVDYRTRKLRVLPFSGENIHAAAISPDDRRLALFEVDPSTSDPLGPGRLVVLDTRTLAQREIALPAGAVASLAWTSDDRLVATPGSYTGNPPRGPVLYTAALKEAGELALRLGTAAAALGDDLWSVDRDGVAYRTRLPSGPTREAFLLPSRSGYSLATVPGRPRIRASAASPGSRPRARRARAAGGAPCRR